MASKPPFELTVDQRAIRAIQQAMRSESDGKALRKDLIADLRTAVAPGVSAVQAKLQSASSPRSTASPSMTSYLAARVKPQTKLSGRSAGVAVRIGQTPGLRGFKTAARQLNRASWRHRVFGRDVWVEQQSPIPGYFDETLSRGKSSYRAAVIAALEKMARRITERA